MQALAPWLLYFSHPTTLSKLQAGPTNLRQRQRIRRLRFSWLTQLIILAIALTNLIRKDILLLIVVNNLGLFSKCSSLRIYIHEVSRRIHMVWVHSMLSICYAHGVLVADVLAHGLGGGWVFSKS